jgi:hypothetical protein
MRRRFSLTRRISCLAVVAGALVAASIEVRAGGPLAVAGSQPFRWSPFEVRGGPLNTQTVTINPDGSRRVLYRVDSGTLGPLSNDRATALVDRIFGLYSDVPTATIQFANAGRVLDPSTGQPVDVDSTNMGRFLSSRAPTFQNPIIFDSDGAITGGGGVLGFFGFLQVDDFSASLREGFVVLNGAVLSRGLIGTTSFLGVFTHEFGHMAGPLDHAQISGNIAANGFGSVLPAGFSRAQAFDLFAPFTECLFPFIFNAAPGSQLGSQFGDSGFFIATLDMDTQNALSNLYPTPDYLTSFGSIRGRVVIRTASGDIPVTGVNVIARRISQGAYPPPLGTVAFPTSVALDPDGVPQAPPAQAATDCLTTVSSSVSGVSINPNTGTVLGTGEYMISGLPAGQYLVQFQQINPNAVGGSGIGPLDNQVSLPIPEEFFNGTGSSSNVSNVFLPVSVSAGQVAGGIDLILNGLSSAPATVLVGTKPNGKIGKAQTLPFPVEVTNTVSETDPSKTRIILPQGAGIIPLPDLYTFTVTQTGIFFIVLEPVSGTGDIDLFLFNSGIRKKIPFEDPALLALSAGPTASELLSIRLTPGVYYIGINPFSGAASYRLRIIPSA